MKPFILNKATETLLYFFNILVFATLGVNVADNIYHTSRFIDISNFTWTLLGISILLLILNFYLAYKNNIYKLNTVTCFITFFIFFGVFYLYISSK